MKVVKPLSVSSKILLRVNKIAVSRVVVSHFLNALKKALVCRWYSITAVFRGDVSFPGNLVILCNNSEIFSSSIVKNTQDDILVGISD